MVSPAISSGWDFPYSDCELVIIIKVPWPDSQSSVMKRRNELDKRWKDAIAMETIVQVAGRGMRAVDDRCEVFVLDDMWTWFSRKNRDLAPQWFWDRVVGSSMSIMDPVEPINKVRGLGLDRASSLY